MTQTDQNTPATATTSKRTTKAKTTAAKAAADTEVLAPVETEQSPSLDAAVNQEKTSSEVELQGIQGDTAGQNLVADVEPEQTTEVNQEKTSSQAELQGMQSDTVGQNPIVDVEPEHATTKEVDAVNQMFLSVNMEGMPEAQREAYKRELEGIQGDTAGQNLVADVEPEKSSSAEISASPVNESVGTEQVLPEVQIPSPVKHVTAAKSGLFVVVKNTGVQTVFEPLSKTSIKSGETVEIRCSTGQFKHDVLNNLKQFIGLGKNLEIQNA